MNQKDGRYKNKHLFRILGNSEVSNLYDAAGSIMVLMLWIYYTSAIFLFGATITRCRVIYLEGDEINNKI